MDIGYRICRGLAGLFALPVHPFNLSNDGVMSYAQWQYERGADTLQFFVPFSPPDEILRTKVVLDIGCGAAGKTLYYASLGAKKVYGLEVLEKYRTQAEDMARGLGLDGVFEYVCGDAARMPFPDDSIDTIIMNDAMEHVPEPEAVLRECLRVVRPGQRIFINFPPYYHPYGAHLSDAIGMPWIHAFFSEATLARIYRDAVRGLPDAEERIAFRLSQDANGRDTLSYINRMTISRFRDILKTLGITPVYYKEVPLRPALAPIARMPMLKEGLVKMVVCIIEA